MTVNDAQIALFTYFSENEIFDIDLHFNQVILVSLDPPIDKEIVVLALKQYEEQGLVSKLPLEGKRVWVLTKPLSQYSQTIELHYSTLEALVKLINNFCEESGDDQNIVNPLQVDEKAIQNVIVLAAGLKNVENDS